MKNKMIKNIQDFAKKNSEACTRRKTERETAEGLLLMSSNVVCYISVLSV